MVTSATPLGGGSKDNTDSNIDINNNGHYDGHSLESTKQGEQEPRQLDLWRGRSGDQAFITLTQTVTSSLTITSTLTTFSSCFTTLVANIPVCSSSNLSGKRKRRNIQVIEEAVPHLLIQNKPQDFQPFIRASRASNFNASEGQELTNQGTANDAILMDEPLIPEVHEEPLEALEWIQSSKGPLSNGFSSRKLCWFGCFVTTVTTTSTVVVQSTATILGATQTLAFTTPGCFPSSALNSLQVPSC
ncbi:hypothetical protein TCAL_12369 [Tigriopus californicus]|uniref:Uncharacterized protein n=2 Tax=Tigriopus californicus TaxID=6832 RepID=A0A553PSS0_TIGCA|nr:hypothetical protein TCAL_12369 [Tigriopus californicus]